MKKLNKNGISLIVLVITIIVMIILAAAIILSLSSNGIIGRANEAKVESDTANAKQVVAMAKAEWQLGKRDEYNSFIDYAKSKLKDAGYKVDGNGGIIPTENGAVNTIYIDSDHKQVMIPEGFSVSSVPTEDSVAEGLVIIDEDGNEFVWIPVEDISDFIVEEGYLNGSLQAAVKLGYAVEPYVGPYGQITLSETNDLTGEHLEYKAMRESVEKNKGFYIGRYEAGTTTERNENTIGTTEVIVQKNAHVYNYVGWGSGMLEVSGDVIPLDKVNRGIGAVQLSRNMYKNSQSVVSTLCYGVQWDAALRYIEKTDSNYTKDSTDKGNYDSSSLILTGSVDEYAINNIYDMAGNVYEWTMEAYYTGSIHYRIYRGGGFNRNW